MDKDVLKGIIALGGHVELTAPLLTFFPVPDTDKLLVVYLEEGTIVQVSQRVKGQIKAKVVEWHKAHVIGDFKGTELEPIVDTVMDNITKYTFTTSEVDFQNAIYVPVKDRHHE